jgi:hypothetical protein
MHLTGLHCFILNWGIGSLLTVAIAPASAHTGHPHGTATEPTQPSSSVNIPFDPNPERMMDVHTDDGHSAEFSRNASIQSAALGYLPSQRLRSAPIGQMPTGLGEGIFVGMILGQAGLLWLKR